jgi:hypothetical protein
LKRSPNAACDHARDELGMPDADRIGLNDNLCEIMTRLGQFLTHEKPPAILERENDVGLTRQALAFI